MTLICQSELVLYLCKKIKLLLAELEDAKFNNFAHRGFTSKWLSKPVSLFEWHTRSSESPPKVLSFCHFYPASSTTSNKASILNQIFKYICALCHLYCDRGGGGTHMLRCTHAWTSLLKLTSKYVLSFHAKNTPKQGCFCYFIPNLTPKQVWAQTLKSALTKSTPFSWKWTFSDPQDLKKDSLFSAFSWKTAFSDH